MPELPEVETVVRGLNKLIVGKTISSVFSDNPKSFHVDTHDRKSYVIGSKILHVSRRAKIIIINLSSGYSLVGHLKMTGQMIYRGDVDWGAGHPNNSLVDELPDKSTRIIFEFSDGTRLFFNDQRKFGWVKLFETKQVIHLPNITKLGPEPLENEFTEKLFINNVLRRKNSNIKAVLLDQTVVSGIGNIYADEVLFASKIHPESRVIDIPTVKLKLLRKNIIEILQMSIDKGGSTSKNYVNAEGKRGSYLDFANVYARAGLDCNVCGTEISKLKVAGRGTHVCRKCQRKYS